MARESSKPRETVFESTVRELRLDGVSFHDLADAMHTQRGFALLDSQASAKDSGTWSWFVLEPFASLIAHGDQVVVADGNSDRLVAGDPFAIAKEFLGRYRVVHEESVVAPPFTGGCIGYFSYELGRQIEVLPGRAEDELGLPDIHLRLYNAAVMCEHDTGRLYLAYLKSREGTIGLPLADLEARLRTVRPRGTPTSREGLLAGEAVDRFSSDLSPVEYRQAVGRIKEYICAGDVYQVNMTQRFSASFAAPPWTLFKQLSITNPAPFAAYLDCGEHVIVSSSPERFLMVRHPYVETQPIKGTIRRGATPAEDQANAANLLGSAKNRAELAMIVDLLRNDLGRVCVPGSVRVSKDPHVETFASVHHLVATIDGELEADRTVLDVVKATFPGGSITGAPKIRAMEIIDELEPVARGVYTGSIGYITFDNRADLNIAIRTVVIKNQMAYVHAGGGVVADSSEEDEYQESLLKASKLLQAVAAVVGPESAGRPPVASH